ncbi:MAG: hypothetical protein ACRCSN_06025 [Dermatophilaceae bacterium]
MITAAELEKHIGVLPYISELFGIYQSLLGWKSKRSLKRFGTALQRDQSHALREVTSVFVPDVDINFHAECEIGFEKGRRIRRFAESSRRQFMGEIA